MSILNVAVVAVGVAATLARHPMVRAGVRAAPRLITPKMKALAADAALETAYRAGAVARRLVRRN